MRTFFIYTIIFVAIVIFANHREWIQFTGKFSDDVTGVGKKINSLAKNNDQSNKLEKMFNPQSREKKAALIDKTKTIQKESKNGFKQFIFKIFDKFENFYDDLIGDPLK